MPNSYNSSYLGEQHDEYATKSALIDLIYPIGAVYISTVSTDPGVLFGGTWEQIEDKFLLSAGSTYTGGTSGGTSTHSHTTNTGTSGGPSNNTSGSTALTVAQLPSHNHGVKGGWGAGPSNSGLFRTDQNSPANRWSNTENTGSGQGHTHTLSSHTHSQTSVGTSSVSNLPPYLVVYVFKRIA